MTATPETREELQALVGPGQQDVFDQFLEEVQQQQAAIDAAEQQGTDEAEKLLAGKFKSTEDLEKAYLEAQKLISSRGQQQPEPETPAKLLSITATSLPLRLMRKASIWLPGIRQCARARTPRSCATSWQPRPVSLFS